MRSIFLGGTCPGWNWRKELTNLLDIEYYDPIVKNWNEVAKKIEREKRETSDFCLYVITPYMEGSYSIAEAVDDSNKRPEKTVFCFLDEPYGKHFSKEANSSLIEISKMIEKNGAKVCYSLEEIANYVNR